MTTPTTPPDPYGSNPPAGTGYPPPATPPAQPGWQAPPAPPADASWSQTPPPAEPNAGWSTPPTPAPSTPPPAFGGTPAGGRTSFDPKSINQLDWGILGAGLLAFIFSLFGFYKAKISFAGLGGGSQSFSAWHEVFGGGFFGWIAMVLAVLGAAELALVLFAPQIKLPIPVPPRLLVLYLFTAGAVCELLAIVVHPKFYSGNGISFGHGFAFWVSLVVIIAGAVLSFLRLQQTGGKLPWDKSA